MSSPAAPPAPLPPGPRSRFPGDHLLALRRDPLAFLGRMAREHGDAVRLRLGPRLGIFFAHPEQVREVLVTRNRSFVKGRALDRARLLLGEGLLTANGEPHLRQRRLIQPAFHRQRIAGYAATMREHAERQARAWAAGQVVDMSREMMRLTLGIAAETLFGARVEAEADEVSRALTTAMELFDVGLLALPDFVMRLPFPRAVRFRRARARLDAVIYRIISERRREGTDRGDLLSMLLAAVDEEGDGRGMSDEQLRDEALTLFLAGHETTANLLTWSWWLLAQHPAAEAALHAELDTVLGTRAASFDDLPRLAYTRAVVAETMRLRPPAWALGRRATEDVVVGGHLVPRGTIVLLSQWVTHRDPRWWPEAERFLPERWLDEEGAGDADDDAHGRPRFAYFPFGGGPRLCIGEQFAWTEAMLVLSTLARGWRARPASPAPVAPLPLITLRPAGAVHMRMEPRGG